MSDQPFDPAGQPAPIPAVAPQPTPGVGEIRTYRGRTIEELIPRIRAELGEGAIILRERQGLTGGIAGFFAQRCVEIDAQAPQRVSIYADDFDDLDEIDEEQEVDDETFAAAATPDPFVAPVPPALAATPQPFTETLQAAVPIVAPEPAPVAPPEPTAAMEPIAAPEPVVVPEAVIEPPAAPVAAEPGFIAFDDLEAPQPATALETVPAPAVEPPAISVPVRLESGHVAPAPPIENQGVFRAASTAAPAPVFAATPAPPEPVATPEPEPSPVAVAAPEPVTEPTAPTPAEDRGIERALIQRLTDRGFGADFATALVADAINLTGQSGAELDPAAAVQARIAASLPQPAALPLTGGAIAIAGPGGSGKTRTVAAMAVACARAGHTVTVARLGTPERSNELAELLRGETVQVVPAMRTRATAAAVASARGRGLVIVDTTSVSAGDRSATEVLAETLAPFELDAVLLTVPATFTARAADRIVQSFAAVRPDGLIATHVDEADGLGAVAEVAIGRRLALGHAHSGLDLATAVARVDPGQLAGALLA